MNAWTILTWTAALAASAVIIILAVAIIVGTIRGIGNLGTHRRSHPESIRHQIENTHDVYRGGDDNA
nr:hypothetical protein [Microbacterium bovistercoris]